MTRTVGTVRGITIDVADLDRAGSFWGELLELGVRSRSDDYLWFHDVAPGIQLILQKVREAKTVKNRVHLDLTSTSPNALVIRARELGAQRLERVETADYTFTVLADPDGNEFCILDRQSAGLTADQEMR